MLNTVATRILAAWFFPLLGFVANCGDGGANVAADRRVIVENYAEHVQQTYREALQGAEVLALAVDELVAEPSAARLAAARQAWLAAREPYGRSEAFRFYEGPIDAAETGPEGRINAWPLDENFIDYVADAPAAGIINDLIAFPVIDEATLIAQNERGGEKNIATGYHAIEFLLWGQDHDIAGPGARPYTDYVTGNAGSASNPKRRAAYLRLVTALLVKDMRAVHDAWLPMPGAYRADFVSAPNLALGHILQGLGALAGAELSGERMLVAYDNKDQEDEHSCFSDNTHRDLATNAAGLAAIVRGRPDAEVTLLSMLRNQGEAQLADTLDAALATTEAAIAAIPPPFDQAILDEAKRPTVLAAVRALQAETALLVETATALGIQLNLQ